MWFKGWRPTLSSTYFCTNITLKRDDFMILLLQVTLKYATGVNTASVSCLCTIKSPQTSMASLREPANRKKAADCSKRCFPSREKAFLRAAFRQRSSLKLFLKNWVIFSSCWDLKEQSHRVWYPFCFSKKIHLKPLVLNIGKIIQINYVFRENVQPEESPQDSFLLHGQVEQGSI